MIVVIDIATTVVVGVIVITVADIAGGDIVVMIATIRRHCVHSWWRRRFH